MSRKFVPDNDPLVEEDFTFMGLLAHVILHSSGQLFLFLITLLSFFFSCIYGIYTVYTGLTLDNIFIFFGTSIMTSLFSVVSAFVSTKKVSND